MVARVAGANVYERFNQVQVGKGYALQELLEHLEQDYPQGFDGYFVFDAEYSGSQLCGGHEPDVFRRP